MAGGAKGSDEDGGIITDINVTPLVDVVLVLLIILMVTATAIVAKTLPMELPEAATGEQVPSTMAVSIDPEGQIYLDREPVTDEDLRSQVGEAREKNPELRVIIAADEQIEHGRVVRVMDLLRQVKVTRFAINVRPEQLEQ
ncbi:MAG: ExbD/TolR family protein [Myxococcota bacterium]